MKTIEEVSIIADSAQNAAITALDCVKELGASLQESASTGERLATLVGDTNTALNNVKIAMNMLSERMNVQRDLFQSHSRIIEELQVKVDRLERAR